MTEAQGIEFVISGDASEASRTLRDFAAQARSANRAAGNSSGFRRLAGSLREVTKTNVGGFTSKFEKLLSSLGRIAFYRAIRSAIKATSQAFNEGLQNAYAFSAGLSDIVDGRIAVALDGITGHALTMKNQLGAAFGSLLTAIAPIINTLIGLITSLATAITQLFAAFTGGTFLKAKDVGGQFADTMERGGGAAKEWKNQLMGFDEINRLEEPASGGGGGGALGVSASDMFEVAEVSGIFASIAQKWRELVDSLDFGPLLSAWGRLRTAVSDFVSVVMSGLLWVWDNVLTPLANWTVEEAVPATIDALAAAFVFLGSALKTLQPYAQKIWDDFLQPIAKWTGEKFISAMTETKDLFEGLTDLLNGDTTFSEFLDSLDGLQLAILGLGGTFLTAKVGAGLFNTAIGLLNSPTLKFFAAVILVAAAFDSFKRALDKWMETGELSADVFADMLEGIGFLAIAIGGITAPWLLVVGIVAVGVAEIIKHWDELVDWWHTTKLYAKIQELKTTWNDEIMPIFTSEYWQGKGAALKAQWDASMESLSPAIEGIKSVWDDEIAPLFTSDYWQGKGEAIKKQWDASMDSLLELSITVKDDSALWWSNVKTWWSGKVGKVEEFLVDVRDDSATWWGNVTTWWNAKKTTTLEFAIKVKNQATQWWEDVKTWWNSVVSDLWTTLKIKLPTITVEWKEAFSILGQSISYPDFSIVWNAKGGIVDGATLIGAGEAGKEAIVPLDRNTEWITKVAYELNEQQAKQSGFGQNVAAAMEDANDGVIEAIFAVGAQLVEAIADSGVSGDIDWRKVSQQVTKYQTQMARANG